MKYGRKLPLKAIRNVEGYTQTEFAKAVNVDRATVSLWECGHTQPRAENIAKIETVLGINWTVDVLVPEV